VIATGDSSAKNAGANEGIFKSPGTVIQEAKTADRCRKRRRLSGGTQLFFVPVAISTQELSQLKMKRYFQYTVNLIYLE